jgi:cytochrome c oxidase subunit 4
MGSIEHAHDHRIGLFGYIGVWAGLMALTALTFGLSFASLGAWEMPVALVIACVKSALVVLLFMHLIEQGTTPRATVLIGVSFAALLCALTILDAMLRRNDAVPEPINPAVGSAASPANPDHR